MAMIQKDTQMHAQKYGGTLVQQRVSDGTKGDYLEIYAFALTALACVFCTAKITVGALAIVAAFALLIVKPEYLLGPILFFTIFDDYMLVTEGVSVSRFITIFFIAGVALLTLKRGVIKKESLFFVALMLLGVILSFWGLKDYTSFPLSYVLNILLAIAMMNFTVVRKDRIVKQVYRIAVLSVVYVYILLAINGFDSLVDGTRFSISKEVNTNELATGLAVVMAILVSGLVIFGKNKIRNILLLVATWVALFLTGSRSGLIAGTLGAFCIYFVGYNEKGSRKKAIIFTVVSVALLVGIYFYLQKSYPLLMERFTIENIEASGGTGRLDVWKTYFRSYFPQYWLVGIGFDSRNMFYAIQASNGIGHGAHNLLVEMLSKVGVFGAILYVSCFVRYLSKALRNLGENKCLLCSIAIFLATFFNGIGEDILSRRFLWFGIGLGYLLINRIEKGSVVLGGDDGC